jgi:rubredoxin
LKCPECGFEMKEENKHIKLEHNFGGSKKTMDAKTKLARVWHCPSCNKYFGAVLKLAEVILA